MPTKTRYTLTAIIRDRKNRILSIGKNSYLKTHPIMYRLGKTVGYDGEKIHIHAEIDAIVKCRHLDKAYSIEVYNYSPRSKTYRPSKPCSICMTGIKETPIQIVQFTSADLYLETLDLSI